MGGNTGIRRDVLRWLVALNLSFPIKNIKRDFSNGFLVAEIFSRYFPHDIQMHSYDYGTKLEKKRDNWTQLQNFFKKRSFVVLKDEIEIIISCATPDGAGPLLEHMYKFLTQKQSKPIEAHPVEEWATGPHPVKPLGPISENTTTGEVLFQDPGVEPNLNGSSHLCMSSAMNSSCRCSCNNKQGTALGPPCYNSSCQHFINVNNSFYTVQREDSTQTLAHELSPCESDVNVGNYNGLYRFKDSDNSPPENPKKTDNPRNSIQGKHLLSAVERARQRETRENAKGRSKAKRYDHNGSKSTMEQACDVALAFRSPHRRRVFKQYTLKDYRRQHAGVCVEFGTLGPNLEDGKLGEKRVKLEKMKEFGRIVRTCNTTHVNMPKRTKTPLLSNRQKALEFAATVPKPKPKEPVEEEKPHTPKKEKNRHTMSELQLLEAKHEADKQQVEEMRRELERFLSH